MRSTNGCDGDYDAMHGNNGAARATAILQETRGQCARGLEHKQERAWSMALKSNASAESGTARKAVSSNGAARTGTGQGSMRSMMFQGTAGYVTRMSGGVGGGSREASSYPDLAAEHTPHVRCAGLMVQNCACTSQSWARSLKSRHLPSARESGKSQGCVSSTVVEDGARERVSRK